VRCRVLPMACPRPKAHGQRAWVERPSRCRQQVRCRVLPMAHPWPSMDWCAGSRRKWVERWSRCGLRGVERRSLLALRGACFSAWVGRLWCHPHCHQYALHAASCREPRMGGNFVGGPRSPSAPFVSRLRLPWPKTFERDSRRSPIKK
jgi:hypothetical protein